MRLYAFEGLRYGRPAAAIDPLVAPPYDQIDDRLRDQLHARSPHQFSRLTRPVAGAGGNPYRESARLHREWLGGGVVGRDREPALYPYSIELAGGGRRLGIAGLVGVEDPASGIVRAHEETLDKPLADRVALLRENRVDLEPVLLLADDGGELDRLLAADVAGEPVALHADPDGHRHLLYRVADPDRVRRYQELLAPLPAAIADGHHRYKTARLFAAESGAREGTAAAAKLAVVTSLVSPGLAIDPIHRALERPVELAPAAGLVVGRRALDAADGPALAAAVAAAAQPALGVWVAGERPEIWPLDPGAAPAAVPPGARNLTVALLHGMLLPALGLSPQAATDGTVVYRSDAGRLGAELAAGELPLGFFLPPMAPADFAAAIAHGDLLPPKSTRFLPKVYSGLVWADHDSKLA
jgi:uncharacterized protein (DUF1015 family)